VKKVQLTRRDERMLEWLAVMRMADVDAIRWALGAMRSAGSPVGIRVAQRWVARMRSVGLVAAARPGFATRSVVWPSPADTGVRAPDLFRLGTRHEVAVAASSARYLAAGYTWTPDPMYVGRQPGARGRVHVADGAVRATPIGLPDLVEVELTAKSIGRYALIRKQFARRLELGEIGRVIYLCEPSAAAAVRKHLVGGLVPSLAERVEVVTVFDRMGLWVSDWTPASVREADGAAAVPLRSTLPSSVLGAGVESGARESAGLQEDVLAGWVR